MTSIFPIHSLDRSKNSWVDYYSAQTPVEMISDEDTFSDMQFKREDYYAPLGYGGINGSKLRQCIWLFDEAKREGKTSVINGTVVGSPQSPMGAAVANHFGMGFTTVLGASKPLTCIRHPMIKMAAWFGSDFTFVGSAYNSTIQPRCKAIRDMEDRFYLEYGITVDHSINSVVKVNDFHQLGGQQVKNIPDNVRDLIIPFGSANSACSILTGMARHGFKNVERIHLIGIGPDKTRYLQERLDLIGAFAGQLGYTGISRAVQLKHYDLHGTGWAKYSDLMKESFGDIVLHPRYEGKVLRFIRENFPKLIAPSSLFWIVGSEPSIEVMEKVCDLGEVPTSIKEYEEEL